MTPITVIDNEYVTMYYYPDKKLVHHIFHQPLSGDDFRHVLSTGTDLLREHGAQKWLSDDRENMALTPEDSEWGLTVWFANTKETGWKYWALVVPLGLEAQMSLTKAVQRSCEMGVLTRLFTDPDEAMAWLESQ